MLQKVSFHHIKTDPTLNIPCMCHENLQLNFSWGPSARSAENFAYLLKTEKQLVLTDLGQKIIAE